MTILDKALSKFAAKEAPKTFNMLLFGAPGVGKGTFAKLI